ncbi:MAG TPA: dipeptidase [Candidatus Nitrosotenuis sp.]|jgi:acetylornithine deacetylase/succinyl-diaminopimelate desuccinylase-like protein|nr:dipeptidase [Candidatus Nitrosotenuis sp.]
MLSEYLQKNAQRFVDDLRQLLAIPSVSADPARQDQVVRCAEEVARQMRQAGLTEVRVMATRGNPVVYGSWLGAPGRPTVLVYGHYDVQPEDPLELWQSPPFEPTVRDGKIYARGATDDKGQFLIHLKAVEALLACQGRLPVNVKFVIEGEEEVGSPSLAPWLEEHKDMLAADVLVVSDSAMYAPGIPALLYGLRGLVYVQIDLKGADTDLHSGSFGGAVPNAAFEMARLLATLKDADERVAIEGFYDKVRPLSPEERQKFAELPFDAEAFRRSVGAPGLVGEKGYSPNEQRWARPTLEVNGLLSGYTGQGAKTVIPHRAMAKVSCRLVPDQDPEEIARLLEEHLRRHTPPWVELSLTVMHGARPWITPLDHPALQAASRAVEKAFGRPPVFIREGGSIPIVVDFERILGLPGVLVGVGLNDENLHAPNEHFDLGNFQKGIELSTHLLEELSAITAVTR